MTRRRAPRARPLSDPRRAPYVRAVLDRKQREAERKAIAEASEPARSRTLGHLAECLALLEDRQP